MRSPAVLWLEPGSKPKLFDAVADQIIEGEGLDNRPAIHDLGFDGKGVTVAIADSGLNLGAGEPMRPDLDGRVDGFFFYGNLTDASDEHSHGYHVTGIIAGNGATGETDENGFLYGLGVAPEAHVVAQRIFDGLGGYEAPPSMGALTGDAVPAGAVIGSNSWGDDTQGRYSLNASSMRWFAMPIQILRVMSRTSWNSRQATLGLPKEAGRKSGRRQECDRYGCFTK